MFNQVLQEVEAQCKEERIPMLGEEKAKFLAACVEKAKPTPHRRMRNRYRLLRTLDATGVENRWYRTLDNDRDRCRPCCTSENEFSSVREWQTSLTHASATHKKCSKAFKILLIFCLLDNNFDNYFPCFQAIEPQLTNPATVVADNVGIGAETMADYLEHVRERYTSETHWFDIDLPWVKQDAIEVSIYRR